MKEEWGHQTKRGCTGDRITMLNYSAMLGYHCTTASTTVEWGNNRSTAIGATGLTHGMKCERARS